METIKEKVFFISHNCSSDCDHSSVKAGMVFNGYGGSAYFITALLVFEFDNISVTGIVIDIVTKSKRQNYV